MQQLNHWGQTMASRSLADLTVSAQACAEMLLDDAAKQGVDLLIYCTYRPMDEQARLYRQGRPLALIKTTADRLSDELKRPDLAEVLMNVGPQHGPIVTNAAPGESLHNYRMAFDAVPLRHGKPVWDMSTKEDIALWAQYGVLVRGAGLDWAGDWRSFREYPHAQLPRVDWRDLIHAA